MKDNSFIIPMNDSVTLKVYDLEVLQDGSYINFSYDILHSSTDNPDKPSNEEIEAFLTNFFLTAIKESAMRIIKLDKQC